jgi:uracil-DNA glycosylase
VIVARIEPTFASFRERARALLAARVPPADVVWQDGEGQASLFGGTAEAAPPPPLAAAPRVPASFVRLAELAALHVAPGRWELLYRVVARLASGEPELLELTTDPDVARLTRLVAEVRHDEHRMHAFLRFRRVTSGPEGDPESFVAWYEPAHRIVELAAPHFARRYPNMRWVILTPQQSAVWDGTTLAFGAGAPRESAPAEDALEDLFRTYYAAIFNPARANVSLFERHVPRRFQASMPEVATVRSLTATAAGRVSAMQERRVSPALAFVPRGADHPALAEAARACTACDLHARATQVVFGEGPASARLALVGEQPGDQEDLAGHPFVGPAGQLLDAILADAGLPRDELYVTNAVKHFKWEPRGKRRIHARPNAMEVHACRGWLEAELALVRPEVVVCLGATAAQVFLGRAFKVTQGRGERRDGGPWAKHLIATHHPSALLRTEDPAARQQARAELEADLRLAASLLGRPAGAAGVR